MNEPVRSFTEWFADHRGGRANDEMTAMLAEAATTSRNLEKPAEVTLKIKFSPSGGGRQVIVIDDIKAKIPELDREVAIFFVDTRNGNLTKEDPMQERLPLGRLPDGPDAEIYRLTHDDDGGAPRRLED